MRAGTGDEESVRISPAAPGPADALEREASSTARRVADTTYSEARGAPERGRESGPVRVSGGTLPDGMRHRFEQGFGRDFSDVRLHTGRRAARRTDELNARAFSLGSDIYFAPGRPALDRREGHLLLAHELTHVLQQRKGAARWPQRDGDAESEEAGEPPVLWGMDTESRELYLSVLDPGHSLASVATWLYEEPAAAEDLRAANPGLPDFLPPGSVLRPTGSPLSDEAGRAVQRALSEGTILRTDGVPEGDEEGVQLYRVPVGDRTEGLTGLQFRSLMRGTATELQREARRVRSHARIGLETQQGHQNETNDVVRGISDWLGDVEPPAESEWRDTIDDADAVYRGFGEIAGGEFADDPLVDARRLQRLSQDLLNAGRSLDEVENDWDLYIEGTISGAETAKTTLEVTRNVSFAVAAGLGGAVAAPAAFAAAGGGAWGTGAALVAGTGTGAGTAGGLEFAGAVGGEGLAEVVTPGEQEFDWGYVGERTWSGAKSGAIEGGFGAAGALMAPGMAMGISNRLFGVGSQALESWGRRAIVTSLTGAATGLPTGAGAAGVELLDDLVAGEITVSEYLTSVGFGGALGLGMGGALSLAPVQGLYRSGGRRFNPFSGEATTPRWMLAGPHSPIQRGWDPPEGFNRLSESELPTLPEGYAWTRLNDQWEPMSLYGPLKDPFTLRWYGPESGGRANWNLLQGDRLVQSHAFTRSRGETFQGTRRFPMETSDFAETRVDPETGESTTVQWIRGHNVDHADTLEGPEVFSSTTDPANYTPEARDWGLFARNNLVQRIRGRGGSYRQVNFYSDSPRTTADGTPIPEGVFFIETDSASSAVRAWEIPFSDPPRLLADLPDYRIPLDDLSPTLLRPSPPIQRGAAGAAGGEVAGEERRSR